MPIDLAEIQRLEVLRYKIWEKLAKLEIYDFEQVNGEPSLIEVKRQIGEHRKSMDDINNIIWELRGKV